MPHSPHRSSRGIIRRLAQPGATALLLAAMLFLSGCARWLDGPQSTIHVAGPVARVQLELFYTTCYVTLGIFVLVGGTLAYAMLRFRARKGSASAEPPPQGHGNPAVEVSLIIASLLALVIIAIPTLKAVWYTYDVPAGLVQDSYRVNATGYQWWWKFEYPTELVKLPYGGEAPLAVANELVIPAGRPVHIELRTTDVIHSFWVPKLAGKVDMVPNRPNHIWLEADHPGYYYGQCAQFCGDAHAVMRFRVIALDAADFAAWVAHQKEPARSVPKGVASGDGKPAAVFASFRQNQFGFGPKWMPGSATPPLELWREQQRPAAREDGALIAKGRALFQAKTCFACHTVRGHEGVGVTGPDLTHVGARSTIVGGLLENTPDEVARWISHPDRVKPGNVMYVSGYVANHITLTQEDVAALVAYLQSLK